MLIYKNKVIALLINIFLLSGCVAPSEPETKIPKMPVQLIMESNREEPSEPIVSDKIEWLGKGGSYKLRYLELEGNAKTLLDVSGDDIYYAAHNVRDGLTKEIYKNKEYIFDSLSIMSLAANDSVIWCITSDSLLGTERSLIRLSTAEEDPVYIDITSYMGDCWPGAISLDHDSNLYAIANQGILIFNSDGIYQSKITANASDLILGGDGNVYALRERGTIAMSIDVVSQKTVQYYKASPGYRISHGNSEYQFTLIGEDGIYGINKSQQLVPIVLWEECGIEYETWFDYIESVHPLANGNYLLLTNTYDVYALIPIPPEDVIPKKVLTMATVTPQSAMVRNAEYYNKINDKCFIQVSDYSQNGFLNRADAVAALNKDLKAGNYPDLFDFNGMTESYYISNDLVSDLYPFIDADPDIDQDDFILLDKLAENGRLYYVSSSFTIDSGAGLYTRFGDCHGWTLDEYLEIQEQHKGDMLFNMTRKQFLCQLSNFYAADYIDWKTGTCEFKNDQFIKILETTKQLQENPMPEKYWELDPPPKYPSLSEGTLILRSSYVDSVWKLALKEGHTDDKLSFVGWPTPEGTGGTTLDPGSLVGICTQGSPEAWEFLKYLLTDDSPGGRYRYGFNYSKKKLDQSLTNAMTKGYPQYDYSNSEYKVAIMSQEDADYFYKFFDTVVYHKSVPSEVIDIIVAEAEPYFLDTRTIEETVQIIQDKVQLFYHDHF